MSNGYFVNLNIDWTRSKKAVKFEKMKNEAWFFNRALLNFHYFDWKFEFNVPIRVKFWSYICIFIWYAVVLYSLFIHTYRTKTVLCRSKTTQLSMFQVKGLFRQHHVYYLRGGSLSPINFFKIFQENLIKNIFFFQF